MLNCADMGKEKKTQTTGQRMLPHKQLDSLHRKVLCPVDLCKQKISATTKTQQQNDVLMVQKLSAIQENDSPVNDACYVAELE